jgi:hypothetical protein
MTILHFCAELFFFTIIYFPSKTAVAAQLITQINISSILTKMHPAAFQSIARRITFFFAVDDGFCMFVKLHVMDIP